MYSRFIKVTNEIQGFATTNVNNVFIVKKMIPALDEKYDTLILHSDQR